MYFKLKFTRITGKMAYFKCKFKFIKKTLLIQAIINPCPQSSLYLIEAGRKSKKVTIIGLSHNNKVKHIQEHQHIGYILRTFK